MNPKKKNTPYSIQESGYSMDSISFDNASFTSIEKAILDQSLREMETGLGIPNAVGFKVAAQLFKKK
jgi:hypothetical protein